MWNFTMDRSGFQHLNLLLINFNIIKKTSCASWNDAIWRPQHHLWSILVKETEAECNQHTLCCPLSQKSLLHSFTTGLTPSIQEIQGIEEQIKSYLGRSNLPNPECGKFCRKTTWLLHQMMEGKETVIGEIATYLRDKTKQKTPNDMWRLSASWYEQFNHKRDISETEGISTD